MAMFADFKRATQAKAPDLLEAELIEAQAKAQALRQRNQNVLGGASIYNKAMGDKSPIADAVFGGGEAAETAASVMPSGGETLLAETMAGAAGEGGAAGAEALATEALGSGVLEGVGTEAMAGLGGEALAAGAGEAALAGGAEAGLTGALGAAGGAIPPVLMAALLSRALGLWS